MKNKQQFSTAISNEEHLAKAKSVFENEVSSHLEKDQNAYQNFKQNKDSVMRQILMLNQCSGLNKQSN